MVRKKPTPKHPDIGSYRIGLAVMENAFQWGHFRLLLEMIGSCDTCIIAFGSSQLSNTAGHPFTFEQKCDMVRGIFGDKFKFIPLQDIDASISTSDWLDYVLKRLKDAGLPEPTDYFSGSIIDAAYYVDFFAGEKDTQIRNDQVLVYEKDGRRTHIIDRSLTPHLQGREVRLLIESRSDEWKNYVPGVLHTFIEYNYPPHLRTAIQCNSIADFPIDVPVGTRAYFVSEGERKLYVLHDDEKWRPLRSSVDEKAAWSKSKGQEDA